MNKIYILKENIMIDVFGSKNLLKIAKNVYGEENIRNKTISSSLESQFASSISPNLSKLDALSDEEKDIVTSDFRKTFRNSETKSDILLVDFLGERNAIGNYNNSKITLNNEVRNYLVNENTVTMPLDNRIKLLPNLIESFVTCIKDYDQVIICEFYLTNYYLDQNNMVNLNPSQYSINKVNALLKTFYDHLKYHQSSFTYMQFDTIYSDTINSIKPSPWIYSNLSSKYIQKKLRKEINLNFDL